MQGEMRYLFKERIISPPPHLPGVIHHTVVFTPPISPPSWACTFVSSTTLAARSQAVSALTFYPHLLLVARQTLRL